jgi:thioredoxin-like negative regulator of GroEL
MKKEVTQEEFQQAILNYWGICVVKFYSVWNTACDVLFPVFDALSEMYGKEIKFYSVNIEYAPALKAELGIEQSPKVIFFRYGEIIDELHNISTTNRALAMMLSKIETALAIIKN